MKTIEAKTLNQLERLKAEIVLSVDADVSMKYQQVRARYAAQLQTLSVERRRRKRLRDRRRSRYREHLTGEALEIALNSLKRESQRDSAERRRLQQERDRAVEPLAIAIATAEEKRRSLKQQYSALSARWQQRLQSAYLTEVESGMLKIEPLTVLYQDTDLIVIDKPAGLLSVPGRRLHLQDSVLSRLRYLMPACAFLQAVHRLDRETSGVMMVAKTPAAHAALGQQFEKRRVRKVYQAILSQPIQKKSGVVTLPLSSDFEHRPRQLVDFEGGKQSQTVFRCLDQGQQPRVEFIPKTGRTHQLRVHAAHSQGLHSPILGDRLYDKHSYGEQQIATKECQRLFLHATVLEVVHPITHNTLRFASAVPF